jgi:hypothetical protein
MGIKYFVIKNIILISNKEEGQYSYDDMAE